MPTSPIFTLNDAILFFHSYFTIATTNTNISRLTAKTLVKEKLLAEKSNPL
jgi:hypothetical protein